MSRRRAFFNRKVSGPVGEAFISTWNTVNTSAGSSNSNQVKLPLVNGGTYDFTVDWGDGLTDNIAVWNQAETTHTYASAGNYTITITGELKGWAFANSGDRLKILDIAQWGVLQFLTETNANLGFFRGCANLDVSATDILNFQTMGCTAASAMFFGNSSLTGNSSFNNWVLTGLTQIANFFASCGLFNQPLGDWDVSTITVFNGVFQDSGFNQNIGSWNVGNGKIFTAMFRRTPFNNGGSDSIKDWDMSSATTLGASGLGMFSGPGCTFNQPIGSWDVSNVTSFNSVFRSNTVFNQDIGDWDVRSGTDFQLFMLGKAPANYDAAKLDSIYNKWSLLPVQPNQAPNFGNIKYTAAGQAGRDILTSAPKNWTITDGGI